jgi:hypothetical protein
LERDWYFRAIGAGGEGEGKSSVVRAELYQQGILGERTSAMRENQTVLEKSVEPCRSCGSVRFNPKCAECQEVLEESLLLGVEPESNRP